MNKSTGPADSIPEVIEDSTECPQCRAVTRLNEGTCINCLLLEGLKAQGESSRQAFESILAEAEVPDKQWRLGHYEILEEIGRGGMGVIYRARQQHSRRIVAVKRIFAHEVDSHETLVRFRREAEAVASLDHTNIVPIHEVSESEEGLPFFSMKYATGGSLRTTASALRANPRECVRLMTKVARAIAYAHGKGVLHRDLQPGNILLDENGEPMVSDFGLAKWLNETSDLTRTLETLGTPGYIAPEQAERRAADLTSAADVYSLGAILFYLLTGRPPFVGANVLVVIHQAAVTPAPRLRSLVPSLDRDLETIVARCLERDPKARYQSAAALADDLEHWLRHEPIHARRVGVFSRGVKWVLRKPAIAALIASLVALAGVIGWNVWQSEFIRPPITSGIAVLPFENLSRDPDNAYFVTGIQDQILTRLAGIADLRVISRTSTQRYPSKPRNLSEIAKQLGVANILEGSVQKAADQVRVNVQLINAQTDSHLWADTFDRKLTDIFSVESEVAKAIGDQLRVKLTGREEQEIAAKPTDNPKAYDAYLRGLAYYLKTVFTPANALGAQKYLREAVRLDPKFALAWARLSYVDALGYLTTNLQPTVALREEARRAAETALTLQPNLGEAVVAQGYYHYACLKDYDTAVRYFEQAQQLLPNSSRIPEQLAYVTRRRGQWDRSDAYFNEAERLDPRNVQLLSAHAASFVALRRFPEAQRKLDQVLDIIPDDVDTLLTMATIARAEGDLPRASAILAPLHPDAPALSAQVYQAILERRPAPIIPRLKEILAKPDPALGYFNGELRFWLGWAQEVAGDHAAAQETWRQARSELEPFLKEQPENDGLIGDLALTNMGLGDKATALALAERAMAANPIEKDAVTGPLPIEAFAEVAARMGEPDRAIAALQKLLSIPGGTPLTPALLRLDPMFDPLRNDPRFQKLCEEAKKPIALK
jgi:TolB-like protein/tRNA A-37 threonylcarbamoyl transferase component Bud32/Tfp pilus assembly protein PilF